MKEKTERKAEEMEAKPHQDLPTRLLTINTVDSQWKAHQLAQGRTL